MMVLITYDVSTLTDAGKKRLRLVSKLCVKFGQRVQNSVFECLVDLTQFTDLKHRLEKTIDPKVDSLRYYFLGNSWQHKVEHVGAKQAYNPEDVMLI